MPLTGRLIKEFRASGQGGEYNAYPYYFAEMQVNFELPVMASQFETDYMSPDSLPEDKVIRIS